MTKTPRAVVYTPAGAGKTMHAEELMQMFGCTSLVDGWDGVQALPDDALVLTNNPAALRAMRRQSRTADQENRDAA